jgi:hypothetical protein
VKIEEFADVLKTLMESQAPKDGVSRGFRHGRELGDLPKSCIRINFMDVQFMNFHTEKL